MTGVEKLVTREMVHGGAQRREVKRCMPQPAGGQPSGQVKPFLYSVTCNFTSFTTLQVTVKDQRERVSDGTALSDVHSCTQWVVAPVRLWPPRPAPDYLIEIGSLLL